ncbi:DgyrCDS5896 [Dimorphilus gyrociliatus]|uniref:DgyrCDS5896 n=1 Tax=Dimorphilus gyrociliatus TaxID=2664684 RepID=A0A7I8VMY1_9ANNE|nr:DgyrCDS5896 [Dimorphilus gyrociliatus]
MQHLQLIYRKIKLFFNTPIEKIVAEKDEFKPGPIDVMNEDYPLNDAQKDAFNKLKAIIMEGDDNAFKLALLNNDHVDYHVIVKCIHTCIRYEKDDTLKNLLTNYILDFYDITNPEGKKLLNALYDKTAICLIEMDKACLFKFILQKQIHYLHSNREIPIFDDLLFTILELGREECLEILLDSSVLRDHESAFAQVLNSKLKNKKTIFLRMLSRIVNDEYLNLAIIRNCLIQKVYLEDLKEVVTFMELSNEARNILCRYSLVSHNFSFLNYGLESGLFKLTKEHVQFSIEFSFLKEILNSHEEFFERHIWPFLLCHLKSDLLDCPSQLIAIFNHKKFKDCQYFRNTTFQLLFQNGRLPGFYRRERKQFWNWVSSFCVLIHYSENYGGLSQYAINDMFAFIFNYKPVGNSLVTFYASLVSCVLWYGYLFTDINVSVFFYCQVKSNNIYSRLISLLMEASGQRHFNRFTRKRDGVNSIMPLTNMAKWSIRHNLKRPFHSNLKQLLKGLPQIMENIISLKTSIENLDIPWMSFAIVDDCVTINKEGMKCSQIFCI